MSKGKTSWLILVTLLLLCASTQDIGIVFSADSTTLSFEPPASSALTGETFDVNVTLTNVTNLYAWNVLIRFDPTIINTTSLTRGHFFEKAGYWTEWQLAELYGTPYGVINNTAGYIIIADIFSVDLPPSGVTGSGTLFTINFTVKDVGATLLMFDEDITKLLTKVGGNTVSIPHETVDGVFDNREAVLPPVASFDVDPPVAKVNETITFDASTSEDDAWPIVSYAWDFGWTRVCQDLWKAFGAPKTDSWTGDGANTTFFTTEKPVVPDLEGVYVDDNLMTKPADYTIDYATGNITFTTAPGLESTVRTNYYYLLKSFVTTEKPVIPDSEEVYVNQTLMTKPADYTIDYATGNITFTTAPEKDMEVKAIYSWHAQDTGMITTHVFPTAGTYTVTLAVTDYDNLTDSATFNVTVLDLVHDIAVLNITASPTTARLGDLVSVNVTVANQGDFTENVNVTVSYDSTSLNTTALTLNEESFEQIHFTWNTTDVNPGLYHITAEAILAGAVEDANPNDNLASTSILIESPLGAVSGRVTDASTGVPIASANVTANSISNLTGSEGLYRIELAPGAFNVTASAIGYVSNTIEVTVIVDETATVNFALEPISVLGWINGTVTDADSTLPLAGASVTADGYSTTTDEFGHYALEVEPGNYTVAVSAAGYESASQLNRIVVAGEMVTVNLALRVNSIITMSVDPTTTTVDGSITVSGSIDPTRENVTVTIWHRTGQGTWAILTTVTTDENSQYSHVWTVDTIGTFEVKASWLGDENTAPAGSNVQTITVEEAPSGVPWELYVAAAGVTAAIIAAIAFYFLKIRRSKPT